MNGEPTPGAGSRATRWVLVWAAVFAALILWIFTQGRWAGPEEIPYSELKRELEAGRVAAVTLQGDRLTGTFRSDAGASREEAEGRAKGDFTTVLPRFDDPALMPLLEAKGVEVTVESETGLWLNPLLLMGVPLLLFLLFLWVASRAMGRQLGNVGDRLTGFGRSRARRYEKGMSSITFRDVAGLANAKIELAEIIEYLKDPSRFQALGAKIPRGILLMGPPGTGKTLLARAAAGEAEVPFFSITGSEFVELFVGVGASRVRDLFATAKKEAPAVLFIDEIDAVGRARGTGLGGGHDEREQTLNQILAEMDGFSPHESVVVIAATNRPDVLDPALLRPGRFDRKITLELPQRGARRQILEVHTRQVPLADDVDLETLAARTVGFSGADLENLINEAALIAARHRKTAVEAEDIDEARDRVLLGSEREERMVEVEKRAVAYHEAGHALVARLLPDADPLTKVTIIPRGRSLGATEQLPEEDRHSVGRCYLEARLAVLLGGRAAEKLVFGEISSGAEDDLEQATRLARRMVCRWGMSERLGPVSYRHGEEHVFLGREMAQPRDFSEATASLIDQEIQRLVRSMEERAEQVLSENRKRLDLLAEALLDQETLETEEIDRVLGLEREPASAVKG